MRTATVLKTGIFVAVTAAALYTASNSPLYREHEARAEVDSAMASLTLAKTLMQEHYYNTGRFSNSGDLKVPPSEDSNLSTIEARSGTISAQFSYAASPLIRNGVLLLTPIIDAKGDFQWKCETSIKEVYLNDCQSVATSQDLYY